MYEEIKRLAVEAVKLQNKLNMEATLNEIAGLCDAQVLASGSVDSGDEPIAAGDVLVGADGAQFKVDAVVTAPKKPRAKVAK
jgi:hypothetical protein